MTQTLEHETEMKDKTSTPKYIPVPITHIPAHTPKQT